MQDACLRGLVGWQLRGGNRSLWFFDVGDVVRMNAIGRVKW